VTTEDVKIISKWVKWRSSTGKPYHSLGFFFNDGDGETVGPYRTPQGAADAYFRRKNDPLYNGGDIPPEPEEDGEDIEERWVGDAPVFRRRYPGNGPGTGWYYNCHGKENGPYLTEYGARLGLRIDLKYNNEATSEQDDDAIDPI